ncbi:MAG: radical SAM protein [Candidatus Omnitrophica bacterium]|nr:radical SAM protein [Candidatus Omnitrophota bacterium]
MKISLVYPPSQELNLKGYPLGLAYLSSSLKRKYAVDIYNYNGKEFGKSLHSFFNSIKETKPDIVGVSFNSFNRWGAYKIIKKIKKINKNITVVLGGVHPSTLCSQIFQYFFECIDFIIQSEGEDPLYRLCNVLELKEDYRGISGLAYKDSAKSFKVNAVTEKVVNLDDLPMPDYSYAASSIEKSRVAYLITSRGCPVNCSFCSTSSFWGQNIKVNSPERVGAEVDYVKSLGSERIFFHDDTFNLGIDRTLKLAEVLKGKNIEYAVSCRVKPVNEEMVAALVESGCRHITWGVESLADKILGSIDKKITKEEVKRAFDICAKYTDRLSTGAFFCVGAPGETEGTVNETVDYLNKNIRSTHGPGASMLYILPGTKIYNDLVRKGEFDERIWVKSDSVYYYTWENNIRVLNRWRKRINHSGIRLAYKGKYFWDYALPPQDEKTSGLKRAFQKNLRKIVRFVNMLRNRY